MDPRWAQALEGLGSAQDYQTIDANVVHALSWDDTTDGPSRSEDGRARRHAAPAG
jgi:hypothetical protein